MLWTKLTRQRRSAAKIRNLQNGRSRVVERGGLSFLQISYRGLCILPSRPLAAPPRGSQRWVRSHRQQFSVTAVTLGDIGLWHSRILVWRCHRDLGQVKHDSHSVSVETGKTDKLAASYKMLRSSSWKVKVHLYWSHQGRKVADILMTRPCCWRLQGPERISLDRVQLADDSSRRIHFLMVRYPAMQEDYKLSLLT